MGWVKEAVDAWPELRGGNGSYVGEVNKGGREQTSTDKTHNSEYFRLMRSAEVVVTANPASWEGDSRLWEALASGALVMVDKMSTPLAYPLVHGRHLIYYDITNRSDFMSKLRYFATDVEGRAEARRIGAQGFKHAMAHHRAVDRVEYMLSMVEHHVGRHSMAGPKPNRPNEPKPNASGAVVTAAAAALPSSGSPDSVVSPDVRNWDLRFGGPMRGIGGRHTWVGIQTAITADRWLQCDRLLAAKNGSSRNVNVNAGAGAEAIAGNPTEATAATMSWWHRALGLLRADRDEAVARAARLAASERRKAHNRHVWSLLKCDEQRVTSRFVGCYKLDDTEKSRPRLWGWDEERGRAAEAGSNQSSLTDRCASACARAGFSSFMMDGPAGKKPGEDGGGCVCAPFPLANPDAKQAPPVAATECSKCKDDESRRCGAWLRCPVYDIVATGAGTGTA
jgi:hypothetical protein